MKPGYQVVRMKGTDPGLEPYLGVIVANWCGTLRNTNDWFKLIDQDIYYAAYKQAIHAILARPGTEVSLALLADDLDVCLGWAVYEGKTLHYCYVKRAGRRQGIAKSLVPTPIDRVTHLTVTGVIIWKTKLPEAIFNPFI